jgi:hypothetical protein
MPIDFHRLTKIPPYHIEGRPARNYDRRAALLSPY